ncbi:MAG TPA: AAA family ATPase [Solirubrobacteraceae bacterium]|nr:AAA family ATPase [Solirubrobacteraceae bacterium]
MTEGLGGVADAGAPALLLEREAELAALGALLSGARAGRGRVVLIEGPAGIGKTRLLGETREHAGRQGLGVLGARGGELERDYAFGVVRQLLEASVARASAAQRRELLAGAAALAESVLCAPAAASPAGAGAAQSILHGLYWVVANLAERRPLLLAVDDLHWADGPSLRFLLYLARRLRDLPVALVLALRTGEPSGDAELLRALRLEAHPPVLEPKPLSPRGTGALTAALLGREAAEGLAAACHEATRGNLFLLMELLHQLGTGSGGADPAAVSRLASERIAAAILLRIGRLDRSAPALVRAASVLGEGATLDLVAALAGLDRLTAAGLADALARAEILEPSAPSAPLRFVHPLVRTAVYEDMPRRKRLRLHARAAQLLSQDPDGVDAAAVHLLRTEPSGDEAAVELLRQAARAAIGYGAPDAAVELLRRAEREPPPEAARPGLLLELGSAAWRAGEPDGVALLREAFATAVGQPARARAGLELALALGVSRGESTDAIPVLERARDGLRDEELRTIIDARLVMFAVCVPVARARLSAHRRRTRAAVERSGSEAGLLLRSVVAADLALDGAAAEAVRLAEEALVDGRVMRRDIAHESDFAMAAVWVLIGTGRLRAAARQLDDGIAYARARGSPFAVARVACFRALVLWRLGELRGAESDADVALPVAAAWGIPHALSAAVLAAVCLERGDPAGARTALRTVDPDPAVLEVVPSQVVREVRAALALAEGEPRAALVELAAYARWEQEAGIGGGMAPVAWRSAAALAHLALGEVDEARALAAGELELARRLGAAPRLGAALRVLGLATGGSDGGALLEEAVRLLEGSDARLDHARALVDLGALLRRTGRRTTGTERLRAGMELAHRCGATALADTAADELRRAGARPRRIAVSGRDALTPSERRVTDLALQGMSNKQIAQALFVTLRTVEMHLSNSYRKLGVPGRDQLGAALAPE